MTLFGDNAVATALATAATKASQEPSQYLQSAARTKPSYENKRNEHDPVTIHDKKVERMLHSYLAKTTPGARILGEEMGEQILGSPEHSPSAISDLQSRLRWIVDPIDGTANFATGSTYFGTSVAAELDGKVVAGAIHIPYTEETFVADNTSAWHIDRQGKTEPLRSWGPVSEIQTSLACYYPGAGNLHKDLHQSAIHLRDLTDAYMCFRRPGAGALDLAMVAGGWLGAVIGVKFGPWDVAAGLHLIKIAGGKVLNFNVPGRESVADGLRPLVLAHPGSLDAKVATRIVKEIEALLVDNDSQ